MSAVGSVIICSPARLDHAGNFTAQSKNTQTNPANLELAVIAARSAAYLATIAVTNGELWLSIELRELRGSGHGFLPLPSICAERHAELLEERSPLLVGPCRRHETDVETFD